MSSGLIILIGFIISAVLMLAWAKWFMTLTLVPLNGSFVLAGMPGHGGNKTAILQTTTTSNMYMTSVGIGTITSMPQDTTTTQLNATITSYDVGSWPYDICFDGTNIWVTSSGGNVVTELSPNDGAILGTYPVGQNPMGCCFDVTSIGVVNGNNNSITKIRVSDRVTLGTFTVVNAQDQICFDVANIWVTDSRSNCVTKLRTSDGTILGTYTVGPIPVGICYDGIYIWVANMGGDNVSKLLVTK